jgi:cysteine desulfurase / selenocysteine lyase
MSGSTESAQSRASAVELEDAKRGRSWADVRGAYPGALSKSYLDNACKGIPPIQAVAAIEEYCEFVRTCPGASTTEDTIVVFEHLNRARQAAASLVSAQVDEIALVESTQHALNVGASLLGLQAGDRVVLSDVEFVGTVLPWWSLGERGVELQLVPHRHGRVEVADLEEAIDDRTRVVVVSSVQEVTGFRVDLARLSQVCRERAVFLVVDGAQHVGPVRLNVAETPIDILAVGGHKWLCSPFGMGFMYVRRELLDRLEPARRGYLSMVTPPHGWSAYLANPERTPTDNFRFVKSARKLEIGGTGPYLAATAFAAAIETLLALGPRRIEERVSELVSLLIAGLQEDQVEIVSPIEPEHRSGIVVFRSVRDPAGDVRLVDRLADQGVAVSARFTTGIGGIRASPYFYNNEEDIERLLGGLRRERARAGL